MNAYWLMFVERKTSLTNVETWLLNIIKFQLVVIGSKDKSSVFMNRKAVICAPYFILKNIGS